MGLPAVSKMYTNISEFSSHINPTSAHNKQNYSTAQHIDEGIQQIIGTTLTMGSNSLFFFNFFFEGRNVTLTKLKDASLNKPNTKQQPYLNGQNLGIILSTTC